MRHKMITLCPTTFEQAQRMRNFSSWVRKQLMWKDDGYEIEDLIKELDRFSNLLESIRLGEKKWQQGVGWVDVE